MPKAGTQLQAEHKQQAQDKDMPPTRAVGRAAGTGTDTGLETHRGALIVLLYKKVDPERTCDTGGWAGRGHVPISMATGHSHWLQHSTHFQILRTVLVMCVCMTFRITFY